MLRIVAQHMVCARRMASWAARNLCRAACILVKLVDSAAAASPSDPPALRFGGCDGKVVVERQPVYQSRWFWLGGCSAAKPNERMQLTWLLGAPSRPASVHQGACGQGGLGSPATQLMRAVSQPLARVCENNRTIDSRMT